MRSLIPILLAGFLSGCFFLSPSDSRSSRQDLLLDGLVVAGHESLQFENRRLLVSGDIVVCDEGALTLVNCEIQPQQTFHQQYSLKVLGHGQLTVRKSKVTTRNGTWYNWYYHDQATVSFEDFDYDILWQSMDWNSTCRVRAVRSRLGLTISAGNTNRTLFIADSPGVYLELGLPKGEHTLTLPVRNSRVQSWSPPIPERVLITNSRIEKLDIDISPGVHATIKNTPGFSFGWVFGSTGNQGPYLLIGPRNRHYAQATFAADDASLTLINTTVDGWWPTTFGGVTLEVRDADLVDPRTWNKSHMTIRDSRIFLFAANDESSAEIRDSTITGNVHAAGKAQVALAHVSKGARFTVTKIGQGKITENSISR